MASVAKHPLLSYQPLRLIFQLAYIATIIPRLPYYAIVALVPFLRPHSSWGVRQTFMTRLAYPILDMPSRIGITETLTIDGGKEGERFQVVGPSDLDVYKGPLVSKDVKPANIGGTWFPHVPGPEVAGKTIVLYFHGGAFIEGDGRDATCGPLAKRLLEKGGADVVFSVQYRLSGYGGMNPFPAALQDALSSYLFLLNKVGIPPGQIVVGGDSAGGNLTTALLRYLHQFETEIGLPMPKCVLLFSPWVAPFQDDFVTNRNRRTDFIPPSYPRRGACSYASGFTDATSNPYITPLGNPFPAKVPVFVNIGAAELLCDNIMQWVEEMRGVDGNVIVTNREEAAIHDTFLTAEILGFEKSAWEVATRVGAFVRKY
ncbi:hypothetical protein GQX73_g4855 [Xylaria multiplex]|uniref:Alpha/beta hydrolase fold-3 domain-containing protein n=1 Tax=Xylaria multiplex TaxID=323545 RepID=A0A7C8MRQ3_9PEZI|nr:hypothetical protein GQX73_g4855 [Xylaria multiplex]